MKLIIFDTNAWLDLYMIHPLALKEIVTRFSKKRSMFWIPEQVYWEFGNHLAHKREDALGVISNASTISRQSIESTKETIKKYLIGLKNNNIISSEELLGDIESDLDEIRKKVKRKLNSLDEDYRKRMTIIAEPNDIVLKLIEDIYKDRPPYFYTDVQRIALYEEGEKRVKYQIPPGLTDFDKEDSDAEKIYRRKYGDFLIWSDILRKTEEIIALLKEGEDLQVIFVENERKGDWWTSRGTPVIAPALKEEFDFIADGKARIEMLSFDSFLSGYSKEFGIKEQTVNGLVEKNRYKESVIGYIEKYKDYIIRDGLLSYYNSFNRKEELFKRKSYFGGVFEKVTDFELKILKCENVKVLGEKVIKLAGEIEFEYSGKLTEIVSNKGKMSNTITDSNTAVVSIEISIDYSQGYDKSYFDIGSVFVKADYFDKVLSFAKKKDIVFKRDKYTCQMCGRTDLDGTSLSIDHIIPRKLGGSDNLSNLQTLCKMCNSMKGAKIIQPITTCPECGRNIYDWNDGGNGFCSECAQHH